VLDRASRLLYIKRCTVQPAQTGVTIGHNRGERLVDFMSYSGGKFSESRQASDMRQLGPSLMHLFFDFSSFSDIHHRTNKFQLVRSISDCMSDKMDMFD
jgi:hypothetical protein